jgi:hypothetical protein
MGGFAFSSTFYTKLRQSVYYYFFDCVSGTEYTSTGSIYGLLGTQQPTQYMSANVFEFDCDCDCEKVIFLQSIAKPYSQYFATPPMQFLLSRTYFHLRCLQKS